MTKFRKFLSVCAVAILGACSLASCKQSFYKEWSNAGAEIEKENCFISLTPDEVQKKAENKESFVVFIGSSTNSNAVSKVTAIQQQVDNLDYEGKIYFVNTSEIMEKASTQKAAREKLGVKELQDSNGLIAVCYKEGKVLFDTSNPNDYVDRFYKSSVLSFNAILVYAIEYYPVEK